MFLSHQSNQTWVNIIFRFLVDSTKKSLRRGTASTTPWYCEYHTVVLRVPRRGIFLVRP